MTLKDHEPLPSVPQTVPPRPRPVTADPPGALPLTSTRLLLPSTPPFPRENKKKMVFLLGISFDERLLVRKALTSLYGISATSTAYVSHRAPASLPLVSEALAAQAQVQAQGQGQARSSSSSSSSQSQQQPVPATSQSHDPTLHPPSKARHSLLSRIMAQHHIHSTARLMDLPESKILALTATLSELTIESELRRRLQQNIQRLHEMGSYRGRRHVMNLPVRGQRTRTQIGTARKLNRVERKG